jgi:hypothetical protein
MIAQQKQHDMVSDLPVTNGVWECVWWGGGTHHDSTIAPQKQHDMSDAPMILADIIISVQL